MPETLEDRWVDYFTGKETSPYCAGSAVALPFTISRPLEPSDTCPPGTTPEQAALMVPPSADGSATANPDPPPEP
jgi:hypothetical protein